MHVKFDFGIPNPDFKFGSMFEVLFWTRFSGEGGVWDSNRQIVG